MITADDLRDLVKDPEAKCYREPRHWIVWLGDGSFQVYDLEGGRVRADVMGMGTIDGKPTRAAVTVREEDGAKMFNVELADNYAQ